MTELEQVWKEYTDALDACCKYCELVTLNTELCLEACKDTVLYTDRTLKCLEEIREDLTGIFNL